MSELAPSPARRRPSHRPGPAALLWENVAPFLARHPQSA
jgi:hypothetical protein